MVHGLCCNYTDRKVLFLTGFVSFRFGSESVRKFPMLTWACEGYDYQHYSQKDEGDAENLAKVHAVTCDHLIFGSHLYILHVFYEES